jgi:hypothetical protein
MGERSAWSRLSATGVSRVDPTTSSDRAKFGGPATCDSPTSSSVEHAIATPKSSTTRQGRTRLSSHQNGMSPQGHTTTSDAQRCGPG